MRHERLDCIEGRIDRTVAGRLMSLLHTIDVKRQGRRLRPVRARDYCERDKLDPVVSMRDLVIDNSCEILIVNNLLAIGDLLEADEGIFQGILAKLVAELFELLLERMAAGVLAHDKRRLAHANALGRHDLIGACILQHAILMNAALMRKSIPPDNRLVVLNGERSHSRDEL